MRKVNLLQCGGFEKSRLNKIKEKVQCLSPLATDSPGQLDIRINNLVEKEGRRGGASRPTDFPFQIWPISVSRSMKFRLTDKIAHFYWFRRPFIFFSSCLKFNLKKCFFVAFYTTLFMVTNTTIMFSYSCFIVILLFSSILQLVELFGTRKTIILKMMCSWKFRFKPLIPLRLPVFR